MLWWDVEKYFEITIVWWILMFENDVKTVLKMNSSNVSQCVLKMNSSNLPWPECWTVLGCRQAWEGWCGPYAPDNAFPWVHMMDTLHFFRLGLRDIEFKFIYASSSQIFINTACKFYWLNYDNWFSSIHKLLQFID